MTGGGLRHLTAADYRHQRWANGRGMTVEIARADDAAGMLWRLSVAMVAEAGPFSAYPGIDRILTVIDGPGFAIAGPGWRVAAAPLRPVVFSGDDAASAGDVAGPSRDFNVMVARDRMRATVSCIPGVFDLTGSVVAVHALGNGRVLADGREVTVQAGDTLLGDGPVRGRAMARVLTVSLVPLG